MTPPVEIFEDWLLRYDLGRRFHPIPPEIAAPFDAQLEVAKKRMNTIRQMILPQRDIEIYTDFIDDGSFNAAGDIYRDIGIVGITKGTVLLMVEMFNRMLCHPCILEGVGNSKLERIGSQHREGMPKNYDDLIDSRRKAGQQLIWKRPNCPTRRMITDILIDLTQRFVGMHEITHILYGHVGYLRRIRHLMLIEIQQPTPAIATDQTILDWQTVEISADDAAARVVMGGFVKKDLAPTSAIPDAKDRLFLWSFALYAMFRLWGLKIDPDKDLNEDHPPSALRFQTLIAGTCYELTENLPEVRENYLAIVHKAQMEVERAITYCGGKQLTAEDIIAVGDSRVQDHMEKLYMHHDDVLIPELTKYAHIQLRPLAN